jgi:hypothetical protein
MDANEIQSFNDQMSYGYGGPQIDNPFYHQVTQSSAATMYAQNGNENNQNFLGLRPSAQ